MIRLSELIDMGAVGLRESADLSPLFLLVTAEFSPFLTPLEPYAVNALRDFSEVFCAEGLLFDDVRGILLLGVTTEPISDVASGLLVVLMSCEAPLLYPSLPSISCINLA